MNKQKTKPHTHGSGWMLKIIQKSSQITQWADAAEK